MSKIEVGGRIYDAVTDNRGEPIELSRYDESMETHITLCFDNSSDGSASDEVLRCLKNRYLKSITA